MRKIFQMLNKIWKNKDFDSTYDRKNIGNDKCSCKEGVLKSYSGL